MEIQWHKATKQQLLQIAISEDCPNDYKYRAVSELQIRWSNDMLIDLVKLYGQRKEVWEIAEYLGIDEKVVREKIHVYKLRRGA